MIFRKKQFAEVKIERGKPALLSACQRQYLGIAYAGMALGNSQYIKACAPYNANRRLREIFVKQ